MNANLLGGWRCMTVNASGGTCMQTWLRMVHPTRMEGFHLYSFASKVKVESGRSKFLQILIHFLSLFFTLTLGQGVPSSRSLNCPYYPYLVAYW